MASELILSVVVPVFNEAVGLEAFHESLIEQLDKVGAYEVIYVDDGSSDKTAEVIYSLHKQDPKIKLVKLSRNFGKESALTAGIAEAEGQAILTMDGDGQHPVELIPEFIKAWHSGAKVVVGVRSGYKRLGSRLFYRLFNGLTGERVVPYSTDYRLIDESVQKIFLTMPETDRITRGLIDWIGFKRQLINFDVKPRATGSIGYGRSKRIGLAANWFVSMTPVPLFLFGYLGIFITSGALVLGGAVFIEQILLGDPWRWKFTGTAMIGILLLFLVGIVLLSQGMLSLYISHMHSQTKQRPLYIIDYRGSAGVRKN